MICDVTIFLVKDDNFVEKIFLQLSSVGEKFRLVTPFLIKGRHCTSFDTKTNFYHNWRFGMHMARKIYITFVKETNLV